MPPLSGQWIITPKTNETPHQNCPWVNPRLCRGLQRVRRGTPAHGGGGRGPPVPSAGSRAPGGTRLPPRRPAPRVMGDGHANMQFPLSLVRYCSLCSTTTCSPLLTELTFRFPALRGWRARPFFLAQGKSCVSRSAHPAPAVFPRLPGTPRVTLPAPATPWRDGSISPGSRIGSAGRELCLGFGMGGSGSRLTRVGRARLRTASSLMIA